MSDKELVRSLKKWADDLDTRALQIGDMTASEREVAFVQRYATTLRFAAKRIEELAPELSAP